MKFEPPLVSAPTQAAHRKTLAPAPTLQRPIQTGPAGATFNWPRAPAAEIICIGRSALAGV